MSEIVLGIRSPPFYIAVMSGPPTVPSALSAEELLDLSLPDKQAELVRGTLIVRELPGYQHGLVACAIAARLGEFVAANSLGVMLAAGTGFKLFSNPDTVRAADAAYLSRHRAPDLPPSGYLALAPDLAVEVMSPNDRAGEIQAKVSDWLTAGSRLVWVIDPPRECAVVYREDGSVDLLVNQDALSGEDVLPGFSCSMEDIW